MIYITIKKYITRDPRDAKYRTKGEWETLNFITNCAFNVAGIDVIVEKSIDNDLKNKPFIFMSTHGCILDV